MSAELKPCPFCGKEPLVHRVPGMGRCYRVTCKFCDAGPHSSLSEADAITAWNRRATATPGALDPATVAPSCATGEVERLIAEAKEFSEVALSDGFDAADALDLILEFAALSPQGLDAKEGGE